MSRQDSLDKIEDIMLTALGPSVIGDIDEDTYETISETKFSKEVVLAVSWQPGTATIWDNRKFLHTTTPTCLYSRGRRRMWQLIQQDQIHSKPVSLTH